MRPPPMYAGRSWSKKGPGEMSLPQREDRRPNQPPQKPSHPGQTARLALYTDVLSGLSQPLVDLRSPWTATTTTSGKTGESRAHVQKIWIPPELFAKTRQTRARPRPCTTCRKEGILGLGWPNFDARGRRMGQSEHRRRMASAALDRCEARGCGPQRCRQGCSRLKLR